MEKIMEAFQELQLLNEDVFNVTTDGVEELKTFIDTPEDELDVIIDPKADTEDELQDSYVGKVILDCVICRSKIYKDPEEVVIGEDGIANVGDICPYCQSSDGYTVIGQVEEYDPNAEITIDDEGVYTEPTEDKENVGSEEKEEPEEKDSHEDNEEDEDEEDLEESKKLKEDLSDIVEVDIDFIDELGDAREVLNRYNVELVSENTEDLKAIIKGTKKDLLRYLLSNEYNISLKDAQEFFPQLFESIKTKKGLKTNKLLKEEAEISIKADDKKIDVTANEDGDLDVSVKNDEVKSEEAGDEMIAPLDKETEEKFEAEEPEEIEVDFDEFDEEGFDDLQEKYFKENFSNVKSYKTVDAFIDGNKIILEGLIEFKSGNIKKTTFIYESKSISKDNKLKFLGENKQFTNRKKAFALTGNVNKNKLIVESISYDHKVMDPVTKEMKRLSGNLK